MLVDWSRRHLLVAGTTGLALAALPGPVLGVGTMPALDGRIVYEVLRNGGKIGEHTVGFDLSDGRLRVTTEVDIAPRVLGLPVYRYRHNAEEVWEDGYLASLATETNDDGTEKAVEGAREGKDFVVTGSDGTTRRLEGSVLTTSLWHPQTPYMDRLLSVEDGKPRAIEGQALGREPVSVPSGGAEADHYELTGEFHRELWYDDRDRLLRVSFKARRDDSRITFEPASLSL